MGPDSLENDTDTTLMFKIVKNTLRELSDNDQIKLNLDVIDTDLTTYNENLTEDKGSNQLKLFRRVSKEDLTNIEQDLMPGFKLVWFYDKYVESQNYFGNSQFVRLKLFHLFSFFNI